MRSSHDQIAAILGTELLKGSYVPGTNMPSEPQLIERFQVSRTGHSRQSFVNGHAAIEAGEERAAAEALLKVIDIGVSRIDVSRKKQRGAHRR